jgi:hypothetical protein
VPDANVENVHGSVHSVTSREGAGEVTETAGAPVPESSPTPPERPEVPPHLGRDLALYTLVRFGLIAAVAGLLVLAKVPLLVGLAVGLVGGLVLAMLLLRGWHNRISAGLAARGMVRKAARDRLRAELRGELRDGIETGSQPAVESDVEYSQVSGPVRDGGDDTDGAGSSADRL